MVKIESWGVREEAGRGGGVGYGGQLGTMGM